MEAQALLAALIPQLCEDVSAEGGSLDDVVVALLRIPHREAIVVARGDG